MRYWYAEVGHLDRSVRLPEHHSEPLTAPPILKVPATATPDIGNRVFFRVWGGPVLVSARPAYVGLAEISSVGVDTDGFVEVGLVTAVSAVAFVHRDSAAEREKAATSATAKPFGPWAALGKWKELEDSQAEYIFRRVHHEAACEGVSLPAWFAAPTATV